MPPTSPLIAIVDDDASLRTVPARWLRAVGWQAVAFASAEAFMQADSQRSVVAYVHKPLDEQTLLQALQRALGQRISEGT